MKRHVLCSVLFALLVSSAYADSILLSPLNGFAVLGGAGVTGTVPVNTITGDLGACCTTDTIAGYPAAFSLHGTEYAGSGAPESTAQSDLDTAITALEGMGPGTTESSLGGLTLGPGVYSSGSTMDLTGTLTLDGYGNANAMWVFLVHSSITTASMSDVVVENAGAGAGVYWVMETGSATLGSNSTFEGNILAYASITASTSVTDSCGRLLTETASVTLAGSDAIGIGCSGSLTDSSGLGGGGTLDTQTGRITVLANTVPEPGSFWFLALCLAGLAIQQRRSRRSIRTIP